MKDRIDQYYPYEKSKILGLKISKTSPWCCYLFGDESVTFTPRFGSEPNWFHRKMQEICFGVKWKRID